MAEGPQPFVPSSVKWGQEEELHADRLKGVAAGVKTGVRLLV